MWDKFMEVAEGFLIVYAIDDSKSFDDVEAFREQVFFYKLSVCLNAKFY